MQAAYLCGVHNMTQVEIGRLLGNLSQPRVSRLLQRAEERGWMRRSYQFIDSQIPPEKLTKLKELAEPGSLVKILADPEVKSRLDTQSAEIVASTPEQFGELIRIESAKWGKVIREKNIRTD